MATSILIPVKGTACLEHRRWTLLRGAGSWGSTARVTLSGPPLRGSGAARLWWTTALKTRNATAVCKCTGNCPHRMRGPFRTVTTDISAKKVKDTLDLSLVLQTARNFLQKTNYKHWQPQRQQHGLHQAAVWWQVCYVDPNPIKNTVDPGQLNKLYVKVYVCPWSHIWLHGYTQGGIVEE